MVCSRHAGPGSAGGGRAGKERAVRAQQGDSDAGLVAVVDPDGIDVLVGISCRAWDRIQGYELAVDGYRRSHERSLLDGGHPTDEKAVTQ